MATHATEQIRVSTNTKLGLDCLGKKGDSYEDIISRLVAEKNIAQCRICYAVAILDTDGLCQPCARAKEVEG